MPADAPPPRRRTQEERRAESDRRMLRAAIRLLARHGVAGASLQRIGTEAGYSRALPAERFGSRVHLFEAVVRVTEAWFDRRLAPRLEGLSGTAALRERVRAHLESVRDSSEAAVALYQLMIAATSGDPELRPTIAALNLRYAAGLRAHLAEAEAAGEIPSGRPTDEVARRIVAGMHGACVTALAEGAADRLSADADHLVDAALAELRGGGAAAAAWRTAR